MKLSIKDIVGALVVLASTVAMFLPNISSEVVITAYVVGSGLLGLSIFDHVSLLRKNKK